METSAKVLADSISPDGVRLTTLECVYPRIIHAEMMTHRMFSRNAASSRAVPVQKMIRMVTEDPYVPSVWGLNQKGMQSERFLEDLREIEKARGHWLHARDLAVQQAEALLNVGVHKQWVNRLLEPFLWYTCLISATEFSNFFHLRCHKDAHPEIRRAAELMHEAMAASKPKSIGYEGWHLPLIQSDEMRGSYKNMYEHWCKVSVGRCARVSYLTHDGRRDPAEDVALCDRLLASGHLSPAEHVARPSHPDDPPALRLGIAGTVLKGTPGSWRAQRVPRPSTTVWWCGNLRGWVSYRKQIPYEHDILGART